MKRFLENYRPDFPPTGHALDSAISAIEPIAVGFSALLAEYGGCSFGKGLYRLHSPNSISRWTVLTIEAFPAFSQRVVCFGYDWLGRQLAIDRARVIDGQAQILLMDIGFNEALEIPVTFLGFHDEELVSHADAALAESFYRKWLSSGGASPASHQCVGYRRPPVLGGPDQIQNLELTDMEVYWGVVGQIIARIRTEKKG